VKRNRMRWETMEIARSTIMMYTEKRHVLAMNTVGKDKKQ
jgi:hypothetical protein